MPATAPHRTLPAAARRLAAWRPAGMPRLGLRVAALLAGALLLLATVLALAPRTGAPLPAGTWDYQREQVTVEGGGLANRYAAGAAGATAWLARTSIERQRDVQRVNLLDHLGGAPLADATVGARNRFQLALAGGTVAAIVGLAVGAALHRPAGRGWLLAILLLVSATVVIAKPRTTSDLAAGATVAVANQTLRLSVAGDPGADLAGPPGAAAVWRALADRYWTAFVAGPLSRLQTGTPVLAEVPPQDKPGVLGYLKGRVRAVNDWAVGRHGAERAVIATLAVGYVLPFALALAVLAMLAAVAQALLYVLLLGALVAVPVAAVVPARRAWLLRWWLVPLGATTALLAAATAASVLVLRAGELAHDTDAYLGVLLAGSTGPVLALLVGYRLLARRQARRPAVVRGGAAA